MKYLFLEVMNREDMVPVLPKSINLGSHMGSAQRFTRAYLRHSNKKCINSKTLSIPKIKTFVDEFIEYSITRPDLIFLVTEIGCGLAGLSPKDVGPLFKNAIDLENVYLPKKFIQYIK